MVLGGWRAAERGKLAINLVEAFPRELRDILLSKTAIPFDTYASN